MIVRCFFILCIVFSKIGAKQPYSNQLIENNGVSTFQAMSMKRNAKQINTNTLDSLEVNDKSRAHVSSKSASKKHRQDSRANRFLAKKRNRGKYKTRKYNRKLKLSEGKKALISAPILLMGGMLVKSAFYYAKKKREKIKLLKTRRKLEDSVEIGQQFLDSARKDFETHSNELSGVLRKLDNLFKEIVSLKDQISIKGEQQEADQLSFANFQKEIASIFKRKNSI